MDTTDTVVAYMALDAFTTAIAVVVGVVADIAVGAGAICLITFLGVEALDAIAFLAADGAMTIPEARDRLTGGNRAEQPVKSHALYNPIETWRPVIALPAVGRDIWELFRLSGKIRLVSDLRSQMITHGKAVLREMRATEAFIGAKGDAALRDSYAFLKRSVHEMRESLVEVRRDFNRLRLMGAPGDGLSLVNDVVNWHDIKDGVMGDVDAIGMWLYSGAGRIAAGVAPQLSTPYAAERFSGADRMHGDPKVRIHSSVRITMHLIGGTHVRSKKAER